MKIHESRPGLPLARLLALLVVGVFASPSAAVEDSKGEIVFKQTIHTDFGDAYDVQFVVRYLVGPLVGEPVVLCNLAWSFKGAPLPALQTIRGQRVTIPAEVRRKVRLYNVVVAAPVSWDGKSPLTEYALMNLKGWHGGNHPKVWLACDPGVLEPSFNGTPKSLRRLSKEQLRRVFSFNVAGSPSWDRLFLYRTPSSPRRSLTGGLEVEDLDELPRVPEDKAKEVVRKGFRLLGQSGGARLVRYSVDTSAVKEWLARKELEILDEERAEAERRREAKRQQRQRDQASKKGGAEEGPTRSEAEEAFWSELEEPRTKQEKAEDTRLDHEEREARARLERAQQERRDVDARLAELREELELRPVPGEGPDPRKLSHQLERLVAQHVGHLTGSRNGTRFERWHRLTRLSDCRFEVRTDSRVRHPGQPEFRFLTWGTFDFEDVEEVDYTGNLYVRLRSAVLEAESDHGGYVDKRYPNVYKDSRRMTKNFDFSVIAPVPEVKQIAEVAQQLVEGCQARASKGKR